MKTENDDPSMYNATHRGEASMKKWAIGCGIALLVVVVVVAVGGYIVYSRYAAPFVTSIQQISQVAAIEKQVANQSAYTPPANRELTEGQVARFVKVEESIQSKLGARSAELKTKYDRLDKLIKAENRQATFGEGMMALKDLAGIIVDGKRAQVDALNQANFSLDEYRWVRGQMYAAAGITLAEMNFSDIQKAAQAQQLDVKEIKTEGDVPERNKELVKPYAEKLQEWVALGFFGL
jgi:DNA-binding PucR family transcriptional regulator